MSQIADTNQESVAAEARAAEAKVAEAKAEKMTAFETELAKAAPDKPGAEGKARKQKTLEFETTSGVNTVDLGRKLAQLLKPPRMMILSGDLGAGKTTLVKGIATALGAAETDEVTSPTFTLVHEYSGALEGKPIKLLHLDLYRLDTERQLESLGLEEMQTPNAVILIEWGEKFKSIRKRANGEIKIVSTGGDARKIVVTLD